MAVKPKSKPAVEQVAASERKKALDNAISQIEKQFGKGAVMKLGEAKTMNVDHISTGSLGLDMALGIGGVPRGRIVEVYGPESSGKTDGCFADRSRSAEGRRGSCVYRRRARFGPYLCQSFGG